MSRGRPRKTAEEHLANGTYRPSKHGPLPISSPSAKASGVTLACPSDLAGTAAEWFRRLASVLTGRLEPSDGPLLAQAARWLSEEDRCRDALPAHDPTTPEHSRALRGAATAGQAANQILSKYGLTPAARSKLRNATMSDEPRKAVTPTRPRTALDLAAEAWRAAGHKGQPSADFIAKFAAEKAATVAPKKGIR